MGLFTAATLKSKKVATTTASGKRTTVWSVGDPEADQVARAVHELVAITAQEKALAGKKSSHAKIVKNFALRNFVAYIADAGVRPEAPMYVMNADGEKVSWITQDRSGQYKVKPAQKDALEQLLGVEAAGDLLYEEVTFKFNREALAKPGVAEVVEKALEAVDKKLRSSGKLADDDVLVDADVKQSLKPGTLDRTGIICGSDTTKIKNFLEAIGAAFTKYLKC